MCPHPPIHQIQEDCRACAREWGAATGGYCGRRWEARVQGVKDASPDQKTHAAEGASPPGCA